MDESLKNKSCAVSVIMPVYNSEDMVESALQSVLGQDFEDFEVIAIDDGSTDRSGEICDRIAAKDDRVRVLHVENGGMCHARNVAIGLARGRYVTFCDNDDECLPGFLELPYALAVESGADVVRFGRIVRRVDANSRQYTSSSAVPARREVLSSALVMPRHDAFFYGTGGVWAGLYRTELLLRYGIRFDERLRTGYEDIAFNNDAYRLSSMVGFVPRSLYVWTRRASRSASMSANAADNRLLGLRVAIESYLLLCESKNADTECRNEISCHVMELALDCLTQGQHGGDANIRRETLWYQRVREVLIPFCEALFSGNPGGYQQITRDLLMREQYRRLYVFLWTSVRVRVGQRGLCRVVRQVGHLRSGCEK